MKDMVVPPSPSRSPATGCCRAITAFRPYRPVHFVNVRLLFPTRKVGTPPICTGFSFRITTDQRLVTGSDRTTSRTRRRILQHALRQTPHQQQIRPRLRNSKSRNANPSSSFVNRSSPGSPPDEVRQTHAVADPTPSAPVVPSAPAAPYHPHNEPAAIAPVATPSLHHLRPPCRKMLLSKARLTPTSAANCGRDVTLPSLP